MPTTASNRYSMLELIPEGNQVPNSTMAVRLDVSTYFHPGMFLEPVPASTGPTYRPVVSGNAGTPLVLNKRQCTTDASGNITFGTPAGANEQGQTYQSADVYTHGRFRAADLQQAGAGAIAAQYFISGNARAIPGAKLYGSTTTGIVEL